MEQARMATAQPRPAPQAQSGAAGTGKPAAAGDGAPARPQGFALLLAALDGDGVPAAAVQDADPLAADEDAAAGSPLHAGLLDAPRADGAAAPEQAAGTALAEHWSVLLNQVQLAQDGKALGRYSMVEETARLDAAARPAARAGGRHAGAAAAPSRAGAPGHGKALPADAGAPAAGGGAAAGNGAAPDAALPQPLRPQMLGKVADGDARAPMRDASALGHGMGAADASAPLTAALADAAALALRSRGGAAGAPPAEGGAVAGAGAGTQSTPLQQGPGASDAAPGLPQDGQAADGFMEQINEQVAFWVHQKTQRAELTLDRDGQAVQVQVALTGDAAKVTFLSDHAEARRALDAGIEDLRAMLREQGLDLAGVNVGVAGGQAGERQARGGARRGTVQAAAPAGGAAARAPGSRALDVFV